MNDARVKSFRAALDRLVESLDALIRVERWDDPSEGVPEPLRGLSLELGSRLEVASKIAAGTFVSSATDATKINAMRAATQRLEAAYAVYREHVDSPEGRRNAVMLLEAEVGDIKSADAAW